ncbi:MAG: (d)CMP kinase [Bacteroidota bacterium]
MRKINIAIDGHAGCGKSTTAKLVANRLGYTYIDSGAMYRAVTLFFLRENVPFDQENEEMIAALENIHITFKPNGLGFGNYVILNGEEVEEEIRSPKVSGHVSQVAVHARVREKMVQQQQEIGRKKGVVMDGRDIGTVVFPDAELKVFMTASMEKRATRRLDEMKRKDANTSLEDVVNNLEERDRIDSTREVAPLTQASDALVVDTSDLSVQEQVNKVTELAIERIHSK